MTLKTSISVGLAVSALAFGVQTASAQGSSDASDRAQQSIVGSYPDAIERAVRTREILGRTASVYPDVIERAAAARAGTTSAQFAGHVDRYELDLPNGPVAASATGDGQNVEWPQLGIGFGIGILFVFGLVLVVRLARNRPLAHG